MAAVAPGALTGLLEELAAAPRNSVNQDLPTFRPGQVIDRFELVREIGRGGFGVVYEARDTKLHRGVALKLVRAAGPLDAREERLLQEAEAAARLSHPNIVTLIDVGRSEEGPYLVLELLHGQTLARRLEHGKLPLREAVRVAVEVAKGLAHAHAQGVVHRDLTPGNVFLCDDGQVKVLDFGMAHAFGQKKLDGGTRAYMAPEQWRGGAEDERTDVFALGVVLYRMLSGELPFADRNAMADSSAAPRLEIAEEPGLGDLVAQMLEKDLVKRPREAGEVLAGLTTFQQELARVPASSSTPVRTQRPRARLADVVAELKRRRVIRALIAYAVVSFAILQVIEPVMHGLQLPDSLLSVVVVLLGIGFPVTVALAWVFDLTVSGIARTPAANKGGVSDSRVPLLLVGLGALAAAPGVAWYFLRYERAQLLTPANGPLAAVPRVPSIAVLPFVDMSPQHDQEYFSDGVAEEILSVLTRVEGLRVAGRTSSFSFRGKGEDLRSIGQKLKVSAILEGSVRKAGARVRITAQLINVADGFHMWSQEFDRELINIFEVQDEIAQAVAAALSINAVSEGSRVRAASVTASPEAYDQYLMGRRLELTGATDDLVRAIAAFKKSIDIDPAYAAAHAWLAIVLGEVAAESAATRVDLQPALVAADRSISLAPTLVDGYWARSYLRMLDWDWSGAKADVDRALVLDPGGADTYQRAAALAQKLGPMSEAIAFMRKAADLDPFDPWNWFILGSCYMQNGNLGPARIALARALEMSPRLVLARRDLAITYLLSGSPDVALRMFEDYPIESTRLMGVALAHHDLQHSVLSQQALDALMSKYPEVASYGIARIHAWRGDIDAAFSWLERGYRGRALELRFVKCDPLLKKLRGDPRYSTLLRRMNLPLE